MRWLLLCALLVACRDKDKPMPATPPPAPSKPAVRAGEVMFEGAVSGIFRWQADLALACTWPPEQRAGQLTVTLTDAKGTQITLAVTPTGMQLTSGALPVLKASAGFLMSGDENRVNTMFSIDGELASDDGLTRAIARGHLDLVCP